MPYKWSNSFSTATLITVPLTLLLPLNALQMIKLPLLRLPALLTLLLPLNAYKWFSSFSNGHCYSTYSPINSAASHELPYKWSNSFSNGHCYSTYSPINSAASPECLRNYQTPSLTTTATLLTIQLTLLLPLNALQMIELLLLYNNCYSTNSLSTLLLLLNANY
jgi:hypothetical protein